MAQSPPTFFLGQAGLTRIKNARPRRRFAAEINLAGWTLRSEKGSQDCVLGGVIGPGQTLQIWAMSEDAGRGGFNCGFGTNIWNNSEPDPAVLINPSGQEVSRW